MKYEFVEKDKIRVQQKLPLNSISMDNIGKTESINPGAEWRGGEGGKCPLMPPKFSSNI